MADCNARTSNSVKCSASLILYAEINGEKDPDMVENWNALLEFEFEASTGFRVWESKEDEKPVAEADGGIVTYKLVQSADSAQALAATAISLVMATMLFA